MLPFVSTRSLYLPLLAVALLATINVTAQQLKKDGTFVIDFGKKKNQKIAEDSLQLHPIYESSEEEEEPASKVKNRKTNTSTAKLIKSKPNLRFGNYSLFNGSFFAGMNACQIDGDNLAGYFYLGAHVGLGTLIRFHSNLSASLDFAYSMKGAQEKFVVNNANVQNRLKIILDYVEIAPTFNAHYENLFMIGVGPALGFQVRYKETDPTGIDITNSTFNVQPRPLDLSLRLQFTFLIKEHFGIGAGFQYTVLSLRPALPGTRVNGTFNNVINLRLSYLLTGKRKSK